MVTVPIDGVELYNTHPGIVLPVPFRGAPVTPGVEVVVQLHVVPGNVEVTITGCEVKPEQIVWEAGDVEINGKGCTVTIKLTGIPVQPFATGVMVYETIPEVMPVLTRISPMKPVLIPLGLFPVMEPEMTEEVHWNVVPGTVEKSEILVFEPEQMVLLNGELVITGTGFTVTVALPLITR